MTNEEVLSGILVLVLIAYAWSVMSQDWEINKLRRKLRRKFRPTSGIIGQVPKARNPPPPPKQRK